MAREGFSETMLIAWSPSGNKGMYHAQMRRLFQETISAKGAVSKNEWGEWSEYGGRIIYDISEHVGLVGHCKDSGFTQSDLGNIGGFWVIEWHYFHK